MSQSHESTILNHNNWYKVLDELKRSGNEVKNIADTELWSKYLSGPKSLRELDQLILSKVTSDEEVTEDRDHNLDLKQLWDRYGNRRDNFVFSDDYLTKSEINSIKTYIKPDKRWQKYGPRLSIALTFINIFVPYRSEDILWLILSTRKTVGGVYRGWKVMGDLYKKFGHLFLDNWYKYVNLETTINYKASDKEHISSESVEEWVGTTREHLSPLGADHHYDFIYRYGIHLKSFMMHNSRSYSDKHHQGKPSDDIFSDTTRTRDSLDLTLNALGSIETYKEFIHGRTWARSGSSSLKTRKYATIDNKLVKLAESKNSVAAYADLDKLTRDSLSPSFIQHGKSIEKRERGKVRDVIGMDIETYLVMSYLDIFVSQLFSGQKFSTLFMGSNHKLSFDIKRLKDCNSRRVWNVPLDQSSFDHQVNPIMLKVTLLALRDVMFSRGYYSRDIRNAWRLVIRRLTNPKFMGYITVNNDKIKVNNGVLSGWKWTALLDTLVNIGELLCCKSILRDKGFFVERLEFNAQGDDDDVLVPELSTALALCETYSALDLLINPAKFFISKRVNEYLRKVYTNGSVTCYPARMVLTFTQVNPIRNVPVSQLMEVQTLVNNYSDFIRRSRTKEGFSFLMVEILRRLQSWSEPYKYMVGPTILESLAPKSMTFLKSKNLVPEGLNYIRVSVPSTGNYDVINVPLNYLDWLPSQRKNLKFGVYIASGYGKTTLASRFPAYFFDIDEILIPLGLFPQPNDITDAPGYWEALAKRQRFAVRALINAVKQPVILSHSPDQLKGLVEDEVIIVLPKKDQSHRRHPNLNYDYLASIGGIRRVNLSAYPGLGILSLFKSKIEPIRGDVGFCVGCRYYIDTMEGKTLTYLNESNYKKIVIANSVDMVARIVEKHYRDKRRMAVPTLDRMLSLLTTPAYLNGIGLHGFSVKPSRYYCVFTERTRTPKITYPENPEFNKYISWSKRSLKFIPQLRSIYEGTQSTNLIFKPVGYISIKDINDKVETKNYSKLGHPRYIGQLLANGKQLPTPRSGPIFNAMYARDRIKKDIIVEFISRSRKQEVLNRIDEIFVNYQLVHELFYTMDGDMWKMWMIGRLPFRTPIFYGGSGLLVSVVYRYYISKWILDKSFHKSVEEARCLAKYIELQAIPKILNVLSKNNVSIIQ